MKGIVVGVFLFACLLSSAWAGWTAGAGRAELQPPAGTPLGAYNWGPRKVDPNVGLPVPKFREYSTFMEPNQGVLNPVYARALVLDDGQGETVCMVTFDLMAVDEPMTHLAWYMAAAQGFPVPFEKCTFTGSHTHSSYAAWMTQFGIQITPTMDLLVPQVQNAIAAAAADAMMQAYKSMLPAVVGMSTGLLTNVTHNRRAGDSPYVSSSTIDPHLGVMRVDTVTGSPIATVWNFACHGTCYGPDNMKASGDILGSANEVIETSLGGVALFLQGDAGDISPSDCAIVPNSDPPLIQGGVTMGNAALAYRAQAVTYATGKLTAAYSRLELGLGHQQWDAARNLNCPIKFVGLDLCRLIGNDTASLRGGQSWLEETPRLNSLRIDVGNASNILITCPVEAITEFGWWIRNATAATGFDITFFVGYTNAYDMYLWYASTPLAPLPIVN